MLSPRRSYATPKQMLNLAGDVAQALRQRPRLMSDEEAEDGGPFNQIYEPGLDRPAYVILVETLQDAFNDYCAEPTEANAQAVNNVIYRLRTYDGFFH
jgi:hypothetical protein